MRRSRLTTVLLAVAVSPAAADEVTVRHAYSRLTPLERGWVADVARDLGAEPRTPTQRVSFLWHPGRSGLAGTLGADGKKGGRTLAVRGLEADYPSLRIQRYRLGSREEALDYAGFVSAERPGERVLVEARGRQVVILSGPAVQSPASAARARRIAWQGLNGASKSDLLAVTDGKSDALRTAPVGPAYQAIKRMARKAHKTGSNGTVTITYDRPAGMTASAPGVTTRYVVEDATVVAATGLGSGHGPRAERAEAFLRDVEYESFLDELRGKLLETLRDAVQEALTQAQATPEPESPDRRRRRGLSQRLDGAGD